MKTAGHRESPKAYDYQGKGEGEDVTAPSGNGLRRCATLGATGMFNTSAFSLASAAHSGVKNSCRISECAPQKAGCRCGPGDGGRDAEGKCARLEQQTLSDIKRRQFVGL